MKKIYILSLCIFLINQINAQTITINGPAGSSQFGTTVAVLPNGNYVVIDPYWDNGAVLDVGAIYLYNGKTHALISTLTGSTNNDNLGVTGIVTILSNGNFVIRSGNWDNGAAINAGAVTWFDANLGVSGVISSSNSLVGSATSDAIGNGGVTVLPNGNYVVISPTWNLGATADVGAVTWCNGTIGRTGTLSSANSLIGSTATDQIGSNGIIVLPNNNYIVKSTNWDNAGVVNAGAATWCNGSTGLTGTVSSANSLVGSSVSDVVGGLITVLPNNNYIVSSPTWNNASVLDVGAVTWCDGSTGRTGTISSSNSLIGSTVADNIGGSGILVLPNNNYVVHSFRYDLGAIVDVGAITLCNGSTGTTGTVSGSNSLVGSTANDNVGSIMSQLLPNGNYVARSSVWDNGAIADAGAVTWCSGTVPTTGTITSSNSFVGGTANDQLGSETISIMSNSNYIINCKFCDIGSVNNAGAVTRCNGTTGTVGTVSAANSLVGSSANDRIGENSTLILPNNNYVVFSPFWDNGAIVDAGAVTWCNGTTGRTGTVSSSNSIVGSSTSDNVGGSTTTNLQNNHYVLRTPSWDNGVIVDAGAITWCNGNTGTFGTIGSTNSLIGSTNNDFVGIANPVVLANKNYVANNNYWNNGTAVEAGAITLCNGNTGTTGVVSAANSLVGSSSFDRIGSFGVIPLTNNNFVVISPNWNDGAVTDVGAVSWINGTTGTTGVVSSSNSLVGSTAGDAVGSGSVTRLDQNYVVRSSNWNNGTIVSVGAVTWCNGQIGTTGVVNTSNSIVGSSTSDQVGNNNVTALPNNNYVIKSTVWNNGTIVDGGAITFANGNTSSSGIVNSCNSVLGNITTSSTFLTNLYNSTFDYNIVSKRDENRIYIFYPDGQSLAQHLDNKTIEITGNVGQKIPIVNNNCRIISTITPLVGSPIDGTITAKVWVEATQPSTQGTLFVKRHYEITPSSGASSATGRVTLYFTQQEFDDFNAVSGIDLPAGPNDLGGKANLMIEKRGGTGDANGSLTSYAGTPVTVFVEDTAIIWNPVFSRWEVTFDNTGFSGFWVKTISDYLGENNFNLNAFAFENQNLLQWHYTDINTVKHFEIEYSLNGNNFSLLAKKENLNNLIDINYKDFSTYNTAKIYYRIKAVNNNSNYSYSNTVALPLKHKNANELIVYPNPTDNNNMHVIIKANATQKAQLNIYNALGKIVYAEQINIVNGVQSFALSNLNLAKGFYSLTIQLNNKTLVKSVVVQ